MRVQWSSKTDLNFMMRLGCLQMIKITAKQRQMLREMERTSMKTRRKRIIQGNGGTCAGLRQEGSGLNGLQSLLFCLCQPVLIWSQQHQRARCCILLWYPLASPTGLIKSWKTQFASLTWISFSHHPASFFGSWRLDFFPPSLPPMCLPRYLNLHPSLSASHPLTSNWRGSSYCYCFLYSIWATFVSHYRR